MEILAGGTELGGCNSLTTKRPPSEAYWMTVTVTETGAAKAKHKNEEKAKMKN